MLILTSLWRLTRLSTQLLPGYPREKIRQTIIFLGNQWVFMGFSWVFHGLNHGLNHRLNPHPVKDTLSQRLDGLIAIVTNKGEGHLSWAEPGPGRAVVGFFHGRI